MFRPCIDLHEGKVKQIVGGSLTNDPATLRTNFVSERSAAWYAELYRRDGLKGGHVIMLGPGNEAAANDALKAFAAISAMYCKPLSATILIHQNNLMRRPGINWY